MKRHHITLISAKKDNRTRLQDQLKMFNEYANNATHKIKYNVILKSKLKIARKHARTVTNVVKNQICELLSLFCQQFLMVLVVTK